jgi:hypothetical protein
LEFIVILGALNIVLKSAWEESIPKTSKKMVVSRAFVLKQIFRQIFNNCLDVPLNCKNIYRSKSKYQLHGKSLLQNPEFC